MNGRRSGSGRQGRLGLVPVERVCGDGDDEGRTPAPTRGGPGAFAPRSGAPRAHGFHADAESQAEADRQLEAEIDLAYLELQSVTTAEQRRRAGAKLKRLVALRSPDQVRRMERERGLLPL